MTNKALGKGLSALIPETETKRGESIVYLKVNEIKPSRFQPREKFSEEKLSELIASIKEKGVVQPVLVRRAGPLSGAGAGYELIAGERRFRAAKELGWDEIPAIVKDVSDIDSLELSLIENIQREDLNPMEEARAYDRLSREFGFTYEKIGEAVGKEKSTVANVLRLLKLPKEIQNFIADNVLTLGHAKVILALPDPRKQLKLARKIAERGLSVREAEILIFGAGSPAKARRKAAADPDIQALQEELQRVLGTRVRIQHGKKRGRIIIDYYSHQDLERVLNILRRK